MSNIKNTYTSRNLGEIITQWSQNNNILNIKRDFSLEARGAIEKFRACLASDLEFDIESYDEFMNNLSYEISIGDDIIKNVIKLEETNKAAKIETNQDIIDIKKSVENKLKIQKENLEKLKKFLEKMKSLSEYKKDIKEYTVKYEKDMLEILSIL